MWRLAVQPFANRTCRHALGAGLDQQSENIEAGLLRESVQSRDGVGLIHISIYMETTGEVNRTGYCA